MNECAGKIVDWLIEKQVVDCSKRKIYEAGCRQLLTLLLDLLGVVLLGVLFHALWESLVLSALFMFLQRYAGSYHARTRLQCYIGSMGMILVNLLVLRVQVPCSIQWIMLLLLLFVIQLQAPVESRNKRLDDREKEVYHKRAQKICVGYGFFWVICAWKSLENISWILLLALMDVFVLQVLGRADLVILKKNG